MISLHFSFLSDSYLIENNCKNQSQFFDASSCEEAVNVSAHPLNTPGLDESIKTVSGSVAIVPSISRQ